MILRRAAVLALVFAAFLEASARAAPQRVTFPGAGGVTLQGWLYAPTTPGRHRAVVALHGCGGLVGRDGGSTARRTDWGERWARAGFLALFPDSFGSRGLGPQCRVRPREVRPSRQRVADANAALRFLAARPDVEARHIALVGWSNGGSSALYAVEPGNAPGGVDFARAIAFYPGCRAPLDSGFWATRLPLLVLMGASDDWTPAQPCAVLIAGARAKGEPAQIVTYPGAYHDFDAPRLPVHTVRGLAFTANGDGKAHAGTDPAARADAIGRVMDALSR